MRRIEGCNVIMRAAIAIIVSVTIVVVGYAITYFGIVRVGASFGVSVNYCVPDYRGLPASLFKPIHYLDRHRLRPSKWSYTLITTNPVALISQDAVSSEHVRREILSVTNLPTERR